MSLRRRPFAGLSPCWIETLEAEVTFDLLDPMNVVYHGAYPKLLEAVRSKLLKRLGWGYREMLAAGYAYPVTDLAIRYAQPLFFEDRIRLKAGIIERSPKLVVAYEIERLGGAGPESAPGLATRAETVQIPVNMKTRTTCWEAPQAMLDAFAKAEAAWLAEHSTAAAQASAAPVVR